MFERHDAAGRGPLDRRGVPRRRRAAAGRRARRSRSPRGCGATCSSGSGCRITVGVARTKFLAKVASGVAKPDGLLVVPPDARARVPAPAAGRAAVGRRPGHGRASCTSAASRRSARSRGSARPRSSRCSAAASGRHLHALAHNRDPRPVQVGRRRARSARSARSAGGRTSADEIDAVARRRSSTASTRRMRARRPRRPHRRAAAALRRLHARDPVAHAARRRPRTPRPILAVARGAARGGARR